MSRSIAAHLLTRPRPWFNERMVHIHEEALLTDAWVETFSQPDVRHAF